MEMWISAISGFMIFLSNIQKHFLAFYEQKSDQHFCRNLSKIADKFRKFADFVDKKILRQNGNSIRTPDPVIQSPTL